MQHQIECDISNYAVDKDHQQSSLGVIGWRKCQSEPAADDNNHWTEIIYSLEEVFCHARDQILNYERPEPNEK